MADQNFRVKRGLEVGIGATVLTALPGGSVGIGTTNPTQKLQVYDGSLNVFKSTDEVNIQLQSGVGTAVVAFRAINTNKNYRFGIQSNDQFVFRDATTSDNRLGITSTGEVIIGYTATPLVTTGTASQTLQVTGGAYVSGSVGIGTTNPTSKLHVIGDARITGVTTFTGAVSFGTSAYFGDNDFAYFGDSNDLYIGHNGSISAIADAGTGDLYIAGDNSLIITDLSYAENKAKFNTNGSVELYFDNVKEFETLGTGATVYGTLQSEGLQVSGISTFTNGPVLVGSATSTGTATQRLQVTGGAYVSGSVGIGTTNPLGRLQIGTGTTTFIVTGTGSTVLVGIGTTNPRYIFTVTDTGTPATTGLTNCLADFTTTANSYGQINLRNTSTGTNASSDIILTADNGTDSSNFVDLGINNSGFSVGSWTINGAGDAYLYASDTNLSIGAAAANKYLSFFTGGTLISNERMRINATGVGIGTTNPSDPLHLQGIFRIDRQLSAQDQTYIRYFRQGSEKARFGLLASDNAIFFNATANDSVNHLVINSSGNVLIGSATSTGTASQTLQVTGGAYVSGNLGIGTTNPGATLNVVPTSTSIAGLFSGTTSSDMVRITQLGTGNALVVEDETNPDASPFVIDGSGFIGIGTNSPSAVYKLQIHNSYLQITNTGEGTGAARGLLFGYDSSDDRQFINSWAKPLHLNTSINSAYLVLQPISSRRVGIGSTLPNNKLDIIGDTYISGNLGIGITNPVGQLQVSSGPAIIGAATSTGTASQTLQVTGGAYVSGNLGIGSAAPAFKADIAGDARITSTNKMRFGGTAGTTNFYIQYNSTANSLDFVAG